MIGRALLLLLIPGLLQAYSDTASFARDPSADTAGGGGGLYFTGSPRQHGLSCAVCHVDGPQDIALRVTALDSQGQLANIFPGAYQAGEIYEIEVAFDGNRLHPDGACREDEPCDINLYAAEFLDASGQPAGSVCATAPDLPPEATCGGCTETLARGVRVESACSVVIADGFDPIGMRWRNGDLAYSFFWRAPDPAVPVTLYVAAVDGRGREAPGGEVTSYTGDGVTAIEVPVGRAPAAQCSGMRPGDAGLMAALALAWLGMRRQRRGSP